MKAQEIYTEAAPGPDPFSSRRLEHATFADAIAVCERHASPAAQRCADILRKWLPPQSRVQPTVEAPA